MKTLYLTSNGANICIDDEQNTAEWIDSEREAIQRIYLAKEPMHIVYNAGEYKRELDVEENDLIITFYTADFENRIISVKSEDWANNLKKYRIKQEEYNMKLAASKELEEDSPAYACDECCVKCAA